MTIAKLCNVIQLFTPAHILERALVGCEGDMGQTYLISLQCNVPHGDNSSVQYLVCTEHMPAFSVHMAIAHYPSVHITVCTVVCSSRALT